MKISLTLLTLAAALTVLAETNKPFPANWGEPPRIQTRDYRELPGGYGHGSGTLAKWIEANLAKDSATTRTPVTVAPVYQNDFEKVEAGRLPDDFMVILGEFAVKDLGTNKVLELPGAPVDSYSVLFGEVTNSNVAVEARVFGTAKGRRMPVFGVGLGGVAGYKLQIAPSKKAVDLVLGDGEQQSIVASAPFNWGSGAWTQCKLQVRKTGAGAWCVEAKAWKTGEAEPKDWLLSFDAKEEPITGRASALASPLSGTPIWFDDLKVTEVGK